jgi:hypothetical protein
MRRYHSWELFKSIVVREAVSRDGTDVCLSLKTPYHKRRLAPDRTLDSLARAPVLAAVHE